jgi:hypothetical protein
MAFYLDKNMFYAFIKKLFRAIDNWLVNLSFFGLLDDYGKKQKEYSDCRDNYRRPVEDGSSCYGKYLKVLNKMVFHYGNISILGSGKLSLVLIAFASDENDDDDDVHKELKRPLMMGSSRSLQMHQPRLEEVYGMLRFKIEYVASREILRVTIIDATDLPGLDSDGKSDPYVEVSLRPTGKKFTTIIKPNCLNPTFNETFDLPMYNKDLNDPATELVLKALDQDFGSDDLIGVVRLPVVLLDLSGTSSMYTCLILHDIKRNGNSSGLSHLDAAKLNLKLSEQASQIYDLELKLVSHNYSLY